jgi:hypothetical protein
MLIKFSLKAKQINNNNNNNNKSIRGCVWDKLCKIEMETKSWLWVIK